MGTIRMETIEKYKHLLYLLTAYTRPITRSELQDKCSRYKTGRTLYMAMESLGYITKNPDGYVINISSSNVTDNAAIKLAQENNRLVNKSKAKKELAYKYIGELPKGLNYNPQVDVGKQIKPSAFDLLQTDIRVKELDNRITDLENAANTFEFLTKAAYHIDSTLKEHEARIMHLESITLPPVPKRTIGASAKSAWNKFIQSLTIKS